MVMGVEKAAFFLKGMFLPKRLVTPWRGENWRGLCQQLRPPGCWQGRVVGGLPAVHGLAPARSWLAAPLSSCEAAVEAKCGQGDGMLSRTWELRGLPGGCCKLRGGCLLPVPG